MDLTAPPVPYRVLARKYRPTRLSELIGQEALVRTLTNALSSGRIAHAFLLAGIRGVGKTTTARIIARALNCTGADGQGQPTPEPCGVCASCRAIAADHPLDVIEMDAATRTGIDDIREIVDSVRYAPSSSRYKVYIIDEVHMLSEKAFNGLLKTLEEPPPHAKFVFATTEVRKLPVTVLSRCQRFDLRRVDTQVLEAHLAQICEREAVNAEPEALRLVSIAAEGSVRDSLSLLDQAIALSDGPVLTGTVQEMLGLGDRRRVLDLLEAALGGDTARCLELTAELHALGAEPAAILLDLLALTHGASRLQAGAGIEATGLLLGPELEGQVRTIAAATSLARTARAWQILLKGIDETRSAPDALAAAEMVLLRLACIAEVPSPGELARLLRDAGVGGGAPAAGRAPGSGPVTPVRVQPVLAGATAPSPAPSSSVVDRPLAPERGRTTTSPGPIRPVEVTPPPRVHRNAGQAPAKTAPQASPASFAVLLDLLRRNGELPLATYLEQGAHLIRFEPGSVEFRPDPSLPPDAASRLAEAATRLTGRRWVVAVGKAVGAPTYAQQHAAATRERIVALTQEPAIRRLLETFPGAEIVDVRAPSPMPEPLIDSPVSRANEVNSR